MKQHRRYLVDGRLTRKVGDLVRLTKGAREALQAKLQISIRPADLSEITKIQWDVDRFYYDVSVQGFGVVLTSEDILRA